MNILKFRFAKTKLDKYANKFNIIYLMA